MVYRVTIKTDCEMVVEVDALDAAEARKLARAGLYDPVTDWQPIDYSDLRAGLAREREAGVIGG